jgi:hypothetical protein
MDVSRRVGRDRLNDGSGARFGRMSAARPPRSIRVAAIRLPLRERSPAVLPAGLRPSGHDRLRGAFVRSGRLRGGWGIPLNPPLPKGDSTPLGRRHPRGDPPFVKGGPGGIGLRRADPCLTATHHALQSAEADFASCCRDFSRQACLGMITCAAAHPPARRQVPCPGAGACVRGANLRRRRRGYQRAPCDGRAAAALAGWTPSCRPAATPRGRSTAAAAPLWTASAAAV